MDAVSIIEAFLPISLTVFHHCNTPPVPLLCTIYIPSLLHSPSSVLYTFHHCYTLPPQYYLHSFTVTSSLLCTILHSITVTLPLLCTIYIPPLLHSPSSVLFTFLHCYIPPSLYNEQHSIIIMTFPLLVVLTKCNYRTRCPAA